MKSLIKLAGLLAFGVGVLPLTVASVASERSEDYHQDFIYGAPADPSPGWTATSGGKIYDNWYKTLDVDKPKSTHSAWPASNTKKKGAVTWRCKSCHGWDFRGKDGAYAKGSYKTGIGGVAGFAGKDPTALIKVVRDKTHGYSTDMIPDEAVTRIGVLLSKAGYDAASFINKDKTVVGDVAQGKAIFQTVCAACHGFDGKALDFGSDDKPVFVGTEANGNPWEVAFKIRHGHPGTEMVGLAAFPIGVTADVLAYTQTLPSK